MTHFRRFPHYAYAIREKGTDNSSTCVFAVALRPAQEDSKYSKYLGAWQLMKNDFECSTR